MLKSIKDQEWQEDAPINSYQALRHLQLYYAQERKNRGMAESTNQIEESTTNKSGYPEIHLFGVKK